MSFLIVQGYVISLNHNEIKRYFLLLPGVPSYSFCFHILHLLRLLVKKIL